MTKSSTPYPLMNRIGNAGRNTEIREATSFPFAPSKITSETSRSILRSAHLQTIYGFRFVLSLNYAEASMLKDGADHEPSLVNDLPKLK